MKLTELMKFNSLIPDARAIVTGSRCGTSPISIILRPVGIVPAEALYHLTMTKDEAKTLVAELLTALQVEPYTQAELENKAAHRAWWKEKNHG